MCNTLDHKGATVKENLQLLSPTSQNSAPKCRCKVCNDIAIAIIIIQPATYLHTVCAYRLFLCVYIYIYTHAYVCMCVHTLQHAHGSFYFEVHEMHT